MKIETGHTINNKSKFCFFLHIHIFAKVLLGLESDS
jgi:hypothetical protein